MQKIDLSKPLSIKTMGDILMYLESRPLGEVFNLFQEIVSQIAVTKDTNGTEPNDKRPAPVASGGGNADGGGDSLPTVPTK